MRPRSAVLAALGGLALLIAALPARPWGAFRGLAGSKVTDTHQQILRAAFDLLRNDPGMLAFGGVPVGGGRPASIEGIVRFEGVDASLTEFAPVGPGPDAEGSTLYSTHWYNPSTGGGLAPQAAAEWYGTFVEATFGPASGEAAACKGLAWSAHYLADMFVPYHLNGMPADEALTRLRAGNFSVGPDEAGPVFLIDPVPPPPPREARNLFEEPLARAQEAASSWWRSGWGVGSDFREAFAVFAANHAAAARPGQDANHLDWFDPWYWNGTSPQIVRPTDPARAVLSSHATYEAAAHDRFLAGGGYVADLYRPTPYDPLWRNAAPDYDFSGSPWQAQAWQVQDFTAGVASRTLQNAELCWRQPEVAIRGAVEAVYTMWRSAYSALFPEIAVGVDPQRPDGAIFVNVNLRNGAAEACHDARLRIKVGTGGGSVVSQGVVPLSGAVPPRGSLQTGFSVEVNPREDWIVVVEAVGAFDRTPDLQYSLSSARYEAPEPTPVDRVNQPAVAVEEAVFFDFVGRFVHTDPRRSFEQYHGEMILNENGTFSDVEYLSNGATIKRGTGTWRFDPYERTIAIDWTDGGKFAGPVSGNTSDFTIRGTWSNGTAGTLRFQRR